jgi:hypothetical protein
MKMKRNGREYESINSFGERERKRRDAVQSISI